MIRRLFLFSVLGLAALGLSACEGRYDAISDGTPDPSTASGGDRPKASADIGERLYQIKERAPGRPPADQNSAVAADPVVVPDCRLSVIFKEDVPSQHDGVIKYLVGKEIKEGEPADDVVTIERPARDGSGRKVKKLYRRLKEGDRVVKDQLLALLDDRLPQADLDIKVGKIRAAKADLDAASKTAEEARERYNTQEWLWKTRSTTAEDLRGANLLWRKSDYDAKSKEVAWEVAGLEAASAKVMVEMHEIYNSVDGNSIVKTIYKKPGESVKSLEPVMLINNLDRLRAEGWVEVQHAGAIRPGMKAIVETAQAEGPERTLIGHLQEVTGVAVSKDAKDPIVVSCSEDGTVRIWDRKRGLESRVIRVPGQPALRSITCTAPTAAVDWCLAGGSDGIGRIWNLSGDSEKPIHELKDEEKGHKGAITAVAFAPDGKTCATGGDDRQICFWDTTDGKLLYTFPESPEGHLAPITYLQFTPQCELVSFAKDNTFRLWELGKTGARLKFAQDRRSGDVSQLGVSPDGKEVLFDQGKTIRVLSLPDRLVKGYLSNPGSGSNFNTFAIYSPGGRLIVTTGGSEGRMQLWRAPQGGDRRGHEVRQLVMNDKATAATCAAFAPDGSFLVTGGKDRAVEIWPIPSGQEVDEQITADVTLVEQAVESAGNQQVRVWAEFRNPKGALLPGGTVTLSIYPGQQQDRRMERKTPDSDLERRKQVKIRIRGDLGIAPQKYEGKTYYVVKDPVSLRYYRFEEQEHFIIRMMNGTATLDETQKEFEKRFRPKRLTLEDLEQFAQQLLTAGLAHNESPQAGTQLYDRRKKRLRSEWMQILTNILYIKIPIFDPDKLLGRMVPYTRWIFTIPFLLASVALMLSAVFLVVTHFESFWEKLPSYHEFFNMKTVVYLWAALGIVKVIHEFGHGLSCKAFGGEVHEMGALFLCLSPCLYCNVSDSWTLPSKWQRIIISFAGIYVELVIASIATFVWWNTAADPVVNNLSLCLMIVCSVSTFVFNANPLMRFDGYYILADWLEVPNLRDRCTRFMKYLVQEYCLGVETQPEPYMTLGRRYMFVFYAVGSWLYRWIITFSIILFLARFLKPYKLESLSVLLAASAAGSMMGWPLYRLGKALYRRGRIPDMKPLRVTASASVLAVTVLFIFLVPVPVSRVRQTALVQVEPADIVKVYVRVPTMPSGLAPGDSSLPSPDRGGAILERLYVRDGQPVQKDQILAEFRSVGMEVRLEGAKNDLGARQTQMSSLRRIMEGLTDPQEKLRYASQISTAVNEREHLKGQIEIFEKSVQELTLRAPRSGIIMTSPKVDDVGKLWEEDQPFCSVGDPRHLQALMPVSPVDYRLLRDDLKYQKDLPVTLRVQGRAELKWKGRVTQLPESEAQTIPPQLASKYGGPLAVKPASPQAPGRLEPQAQQYLVSVEFLNPDDGICPGTLAQVKVHCRWRTMAWWIWRSINSAFDLGLI